MTQIRRVSHSEMKLFLRCRRKWWLTNILQLAPVGYDPAGPLRTGSRLHTALEAVYMPGHDVFAVLKKAQSDDWQAYVNAVAGEAVPEVYTQFMKDCELERIMLEGYMQWVEENGVDADLTVISTEEVITIHGEEFAPDLVERFGEFDVVGKLDMRVRRNSDGARLFLDHKTARSLTEMLPGLSQDSQMLHYHWLEFMSQEDGWCDGALYNVLKKVKRTKTANPPFFARYEVPHGADEIRSYMYSMVEIIHDMFTVEERLREGIAGPNLLAASRIAYKSRTRDCDWDCQFKTLCPLFDDGSRVEAMINEQFEVRNPLARYDQVFSEGV